MATAWGSRTTYWPHSPFKTAAVAIPDRGGNNFLQWNPKIMQYRVRVLEEGWADLIGVTQSFLGYVEIG